MQFSAKTKATIKKMKMMFTSIDYVFHLKCKKMSHDIRIKDKTNTPSHKRKIQLRTVQEGGKAQS